MRNEKVLDNLRKIFLSSSILRGFRNPMLNELYHFYTRIHQIEGSGAT